MATTYYYSVMGQIVGESTSGVRTDYLTDALGSVVATVDNTAAVVNTYRYKPYGDQLSKSGVGVDPKFLWVGSWGYRRTGNTWAEAYVRARHYGTKQASWTTVDPLWPHESTYSYVGGRASAIHDRTGMSCANPCDEPRHDGLLDPPKTCPPFFSNDLNESFSRFCGKSGIDIGRLSKCVKSNIKPGICDGVNLWQLTDEYSKCMAGYCQSPPKIICNPNDAGCGRDTCAIAGKQPPCDGKNVTITFCRVGFCVGGKFSNPGCRSSDPIYGIEGLRGNYQDTLVLLIHELTHGCLTCKKTQENGPCLETFTQAVAVCIARDL